MLSDDTLRIVQVGVLIVRPKETTMPLPKNDSEKVSTLHYHNPEGHKGLTEK